MVVSELSEASIDVLRQLIGKKVHTLWCPNLDAAGAHLAAWTFSILISKDQFINFTCEWSETPKLFNDSWLIGVAANNGPLNIKKRDDGAYLDVCSISIYGAQPVEKIEVFQYEYKPVGESSDEWVQYDQAILFRCPEDRQFCIGCMLNGPGVATYLHFSEDSKVIEEMISGSRVRLVLE